MKTAATHGTSRFAYPGTLAMLALAFAFPITLMVFNPTLMFERGWEQYVGTGLYFWAVIALGRKLSGSGVTNPRSMRLPPGSPAWKAQRRRQTVRPHQRGGSPHFFPRTSASFPIIWTSRGGRRSANSWKSIAKARRWIQEHVAGRFALPLAIFFISFR